MDIVIISAFLSFIITFITIPIVINVAELKRLYDEPSFRKAHKTNIPNLGGLVIFASVFFTTTLLIDFRAFEGYNFVLAALTILFFVGLKDDILVIAFTWKFLGQLFAALLIVVLGDIRLTSFYGVFGIYHISYISSVISSVFLVILIINSFNLIDGIDCLASVIGILIFFIYGCWFIVNEQYQLAVVALSIGSSIIGFIYYNFPPAKIFMGDTGSLTIGLIMSVLTIKFIELNGHGTGNFIIDSIPAITLAILIVPLFDTLRIFFVRLLRKRSPFNPDKNHLHHKIVDLGFNHISSSIILLGVNIIIIIMAFTLQIYKLNVNYIMLIVFIIAGALSQLPYILSRRKLNKIQNNQ
jgi:UDP-N-acetylmuramyl pentapeptide phosphotransferase/UDP-N-acetylglucosamine-1-phosphate transferase